MADVTSTDATFLLVGTADGAGEALADELTRRGAMVEWAEPPSARDVAFVLAPDLVLLWGESAAGGGAAAIEQLRAEALDPDIALAVVVRSAGERALAEAAGARAGLLLRDPARLADDLLRVLAGEAPEPEAPEPPEPKAPEPKAPEPKATETQTEPKPSVAAPTAPEPARPVVPQPAEPKRSPAPGAVPKPAPTPHAHPKVTFPKPSVAKPAPAKLAPRPASARPRPASVPPPALVAHEDEAPARPASARPASVPPPAAFAHEDEAPARPASVRPASVPPPAAFAHEDEAPARPASVRPRPASVPPPAAFASPVQGELILPPLAPAPSPRPASEPSRPSGPKASLPLPPSAVIDARERADATPVAAPAADAIAASRAAPIEPAATSGDRAEPEGADEWSNLPSFGIASQPPASATPAAAVPVLTPPAAPLPRSERPPAPSAAPLSPAPERAPASRTGLFVSVGVVALVSIFAAAWALRGEDAPPPAAPPPPVAPPPPPPVAPDAGELAEAEPDAPTPSPEVRDEADLSPRERIDRLILAANYNRQHGEPARAEEDYRAVLEIDPRNPRAMVGLTRLATARGDHRGAVEWARRLTTEHPRLASNFVVLGDALAASGDRDAARRAYEQALSISPTLELARSRLDGM